MPISSGKIKFVYVSTGHTIPSEIDVNTVYFEEDTRQIYVGSRTPIANFGLTSKDLENYEVKTATITGSGNAVIGASFDAITGNLSMTLGTLETLTVGEGNVVTDVSTSGQTTTATKGATAVLTTGDQVVSGVKTFNDPPVSATDPTEDTQLTNKGYVDTTIHESLSELGPMVYVGTVGINGTVTQLPAPSLEIVGNTYKVITDGTYAGQVAKIGDMFICSRSLAWTLVPSGDEPSGTVTNVATGDGLTGGPITTSGTISHADTSSVQDLTPTTDQFVDGMTFDGFGHVVSVSHSEAPRLRWIVVDSQ